MAKSVAAKRRAAAGAAFHLAMGRLQRPAGGIEEGVVQKAAALEKSVKSAKSKIADKVVVLAQEQDGQVQDVKTLYPR